MSTDLASVARDSRYHLEAYHFLQRGLDYTVKRIHGEDEPEDPTVSRHISGQQLCYGLRDFALEEYGLLARTVLKRWGVYDCEDFGRMVFSLVDAGLMQKTDEDSIEDFTDVFDFSEAFSPAMLMSENG